MASIVIGRRNTMADYQNKVLSFRYQETEQNIKRKEVDNKAPFDLEINLFDSIELSDYKEKNLSYYYDEDTNLFLCVEARRNHLLFYVDRKPLNILLFKKDDPKVKDMISYILNENNYFDNEDLDFKIYDFEKDLLVEKNLYYLIDPQGDRYLKDKPCELYKYECLLIKEHDKEYENAYYVSVASYQSNDVIEKKKILGFYKKEGFVKVVNNKIIYSNSNDYTKFSSNYVSNSIDTFLKKNFYLTIKIDEKEYTKKEKAFIYFTHLNRKYYARIENSILVFDRLFLETDGYNMDSYFIDFNEAFEILKYIKENLSHLISNCNLKFEVKRLSDGKTLE